MKETNCKFDHFKGETQFVNNRCSAIKEMENAKRDRMENAQAFDGSWIHSTQFDIIWWKNSFSNWNFAKSSWAIRDKACSNIGLIAVCTKSSSCFSIIVEGVISFPLCFFFPPFQRWERPYIYHLLQNKSYFYTFEINFANSW